MSWLCRRRCGSAWAWALDKENGIDVVVITTLLQRERRRIQVRWSETEELKRETPQVRRQLCRGCGSDRAASGWCCRAGDVAAPAPALRDRQGGQADLRRAFQFRE